MIFLMRMCPLIPYNIFNYFMAVTKVSKRDFFLGSFGFIIPAIPYIYISMQMSNLEAIVKGDLELGIGETILMIIGGIIMVIIIGVVFYFARKEYKLLKTI